MSAKRNDLVLPSRQITGLTDAGGRGLVRITATPRAGRNDQRKLLSESAQSNRSFN